jgi:hypothetical protein
MKRTIIAITFIALVILIITCQKEENPPINTSGDYVVFAWNDLGMHCLNPTYDELVILPPYNTVNVQIIKRGNPPSVVTGDVSVEYSIINNTSSSDKRSYGGFWTYFTQLFGGTAPANDIGLTGTALSGLMTLKTDHFTAEGMPVVPVDDAGTWDPFQVIEVKVKDVNGTVLATTQATVPTSDEINCAKCHSEDGSSAFSNILNTHDEEEGTTLFSQKPVLCAKCHGSPALGTTGPGTSGKYLSQAIHGYHASKNASCYDCHPGSTTRCSRSLAHMGTTDDGNCTTCHGTMANVASTIESGNRVPWIGEPQCIKCHTGVSGLESGTALYRHSEGHGNLYCSACHGSPHAMYPSREAKDNFQPDQYQGSTIKTIGSCGVCHDDSRGEGSGGEFNETHGGTNPEHKNACHVCHTVVPSTTASWPHAYSWENSN